MMHMIIRSKIADEFRGAIEEGKYYVLKIVCVLEYKAKYKLCKQNFFIQFHSGTTLDEMIDKLPRIPRHKFLLIPFEQHEKSADQGGFLINIAGRLCGLSEKIEKQGQTQKIAMQYVDLEYLQQRKIRVTLWESFAKILNRDELDLTKELYVLIITSTIMRRFQGRISVTSSSATKIFVNLDYPDVKLMRQSFSRTDVIPIEHIQIINNVISREEIESNKKSISDMKLLLEQPEDMDDMGKPLPQVIERIIGGSYVFQAKVNMFNLGTQKEDFTVIRLYLPIEMKNGKKEKEGIEQGNGIDTAVDIGSVTPPKKDKLRQKKPNC